MYLIDIPNYSQEPENSDHSSYDSGRAISNIFG